MPQRLRGARTLGLLRSRKTGTSWHGLWGAHGRWPDDRLGARAQPNQSGKLRKVRAETSADAGWMAQGRSTAPHGVFTSYAGRIQASLLHDRHFFTSPLHYSRRIYDLNDRTYVRS